MATHVNATLVVLIVHSGSNTMLPIVLFLIIVTLLFLGNDKRHAGTTTVPTRLPYSHHDVVVRESKRLTAYADFILDGGELYE